MDSQLICKHCKGNISSSDYFCPNCGEKVKEKLLPTTIGRQLLVYLLSVFLPPLGIWPAIKYLRQQDEKSKKIGLAALLLTIASIVITSWLTINFINSFKEGLNNQLNLYQDIDF